MDGTVRKFGYKMQLFNRESPVGENEKIYVGTFERRVVILKSYAAALNEPPYSEKNWLFPRCPKWRREAWISYKRKSGSPTSLLSPRSAAPLSACG